MKPLITIIFILLFFHFISAHCQNLTGVAGEENLRALEGLKGNVPIQTFALGYEGVKGSVYLFDEWTDGTIVLSGNQVVTDVRLKFDAYNNELLYLNPEKGDSLVLNKQTIFQFDLKKDKESRKFSKFNFNPGGNQPDFRFAEVMYDGATQLIRYYYRNLLKADYTGAYSSGRRYDELVPEEDLYVVKSDGSLSKVKTSKGSITKALDDQKNKVKDYIKNQDLAVKSLDELIRIIQYYDTL